MSQNFTILEKFYDQKLDHSGNSSETWKQRYFENREYYKPGGPVFVALCGPLYYPTTPELLQHGSMVQYAEQQNGALILLEVRYYGKSRPTGDISLSNLNKYLTVEISLADIETFFKWIKMESEFKNAKIVAFGHGNLGTRISVNMLKNPDLVDIAVLSSSPVEVRFEIPEWHRRAADIMRRINPECAVTVHDAVLCFDKIVHGESCEEHDITDLRETFNLCSEVDVSKPQDSIALVSEILRMIGELVFFSSPDPNAVISVENMCKTMGDTSEGLSHMDKLAKEMKLLQKEQGVKCLEHRLDKIIEAQKETEWNPTTELGLRTFMYSRCKYGMMLRTPEGYMLGQERIDNYRNYILEQCRQAYGLTPEEVEAGSMQTNELYGKRRVPKKCAIFFSEGGDLMRDIEITTEEEAGQCNAVVSSESGSFVSDGADIGEQDPEGSKGIVAAQNKLGGIINRWLKSGNCCAQEAEKLHLSPRRFFYL